MPCVPDTTNGVIIVRGNEAPCWVFPDRDRPRYRLKELAGSRITPYSKSLELEILARNEPDNSGYFETLLHQYGYNHGALPVSMVWMNRGERHQAVIEPDDSFYIKPGVAHWFTRISDAQRTGNDDARLLLLRVGGKLTGDAVSEASAMGSASMRRVAAETRCWFEEE